MTMSSYYNLPIDASRYAHGYFEFLSRTNFRNSVIDVFNRTVSSYLSSGDGSVLDIGCSDGLMTSRYLQSAFLTAHFSPKNVTLVEPAQDSLHLANRTIASHYPNSKILSLDLPALEVLNEMSNGYDFIIASYVFYHLPSEILVEFIRKLKIGGSMMITMGAGNNPLRFDPRLSSKSNHGDSNNILNVLQNLTSEKAEIEYEVYRVPTELDLNNLVNIDGQLLPVARILFEFLLNTEVDSLSEDEIEGIKDTIKHFVTEHDGIVRHHHNLIWIRKK